MSRSIHLMKFNFINHYTYPYENELADCSLKHGFVNGAKYLPLFLCTIYYKGTGSSNSPALQPHPLKIIMVYIIQH